MKRLIIVLVTIASLAGCGKKKEMHPLDLEVRPVRYIVVEQKENILQRQFTGNITSTAISQLSFRVAGTVVQRYVGLGDRVVKGQVLAKLDPIDYEVKYQQAFAQLENAKASLSEARSNFERDRILYLDNSVSKAQYESSQAAYESAKATVEAGAKNVEFNRLQLDYTTLVSPADGTIAKVDTEVNEAVTPQKPVFMINTSGGFEVIFSVSEDIVSRLKLGEKIQVGVSALDDKIPATITNIGSVSTNFGNTYPVKAFISNAPERLRVGMTATVYIDLNVDPSNKPQITIPVNSVVPGDENQKYVYIVTDVQNEEGIVKKVPVKLGAVSTFGVEVLEGLESGEYLITAGVNQVIEGQKVKLSQKGE